MQTPAPPRHTLPKRKYFSRSTFLHRSNTMMPTHDIPLRARADVLVPLQHHKLGPSRMMLISRDHARRIVSRNPGHHEPLDGVPTSRKKFVDGQCSSDARYRGTKTSAHTARFPGPIAASRRDDCPKLRADTSASSVAHFCRATRSSAVHCGNPRITTGSGGSCRFDANGTRDRRSRRSRRTASRAGKNRADKRYAE